MKQNQRVIKKGDYYELQTIQDLMMQQKIPKKQQVGSMTNIPVPNENILTQLPARSQAIRKYQIAASAKIRTDDHGLDDYQNSLQQILKLPIKDQQRLEIQKLMKQISVIKNSSELPLNKLPQNKQIQQKYEKPKQILLVSQFNTQKLQQSVANLQNIKYIQLSRLQHIVEILLGSDVKTEQTNTQQNSQIDDKTKQDIEAVYNNLSQLKCLNNLSGIINKISANQTKYVEMCNWVNKSEEANKINKQILDQFQNDELMLKQLQENFKKNVQVIRGIIKKLSD